MRICVINNCDRTHYARGWCSKHYNHWRRHEAPPFVRPTLLERVMTRVDKAGPVPAERPDLGPCWIWTGYVMPFGHGQVNRGTGLGTALVHRVVFEHLMGDVPEGLELDHLCRVPACCNPQHLEPVTHAENVRRGRANEVARRLAAQRTRCVNGHPYEGANYRITKNGRRRCRVCNREWARQSRAAAKKAVAA